MAAQAGDTGIGTDPQRMVAIFGQDTHKIAAQPLFRGIPGYDAILCRRTYPQSIAGIPYPQDLIGSPQKSPHFYIGRQHACVSLVTGMGLHHPLVFQCETQQPPDCAQPQCVVITESQCPYTHMVGNLRVVPLHLHCCFPAKVYQVKSVARTGPGLIFRQRQQAPYLGNFLSVPANFHGLPSVPLPMPKHSSILRTKPDSAACICRTAQYRTHHGHIRRNRTKIQRDSRFKRLRTAQEALVEGRQPKITFRIELNATYFIGMCLRVLQVEKLAQVGIQYAPSFRANPQQPFRVVIAGHHTCLDILVAVVLERMKGMHLQFPFRSQREQRIAVPRQRQVT